MRHGLGKLYLSNGSCFEGNFYKNAKHGEGKTILENGEEFTEIWNQGILIDSINCKELNDNEK